MNAVIAAASGLVFGFGLLAAGMASPLKVKAFLDVAGAWDPSLAFVMAGAIAVGVGAFALAKRRRASWTGMPIEIPNDKLIDKRLLFGGLLFGVGWGVAGFCPGPALVAVGAGSIPALIFTLAMLVGMAAHDALTTKRQTAP